MRYVGRGAGVSNILKPKRGGIMIGAVILAAGMSQRMGRQKLFLPFKRHTIIEEVIDHIKASKVDCILLIYGNQDDRWEKIAIEKEIACKRNSEYQKGQSTSVKKGIEMMPDGMDGIMFILGDQPLIDSKVINKIIDTFYERKASIVVPLYKGVRGNPVLFHAKWRETLFNVKGDKGARDIILQNKDEVSYIRFNDSMYNIDVDTKEDYQNILMAVSKTCKS
ncbi:molybdenum cofactor cytidylyltransferase [Clostridiaceae bacterium 35-E11]